MNQLELHGGGMVESLNYSMTKKGKKYLCENRMEKTNDSMKIKFKITKNSNY